MKRNVNFSEALTVKRSRLVTGEISDNFVLYEHNRFYHTYVPYQISMIKFIYRKKLFDLLKRFLRHSWDNFCPYKQALKMCKK